MINTITEIIKKVEGFRKSAYDDGYDNITIGYGTCLTCRSTSELLSMVSYCNSVSKSTYIYSDLFNESITKDYAEQLLSYDINQAIQKVNNRISELNYSWSDYREFHKILLIDIAYNTGNISKWHKVFNPNLSPKEVLFECRRLPHELDSRIAKIGYQLGIINSIEEARNIGLTQAKYII
jgi:GH24 family phage-related lysozyme (muramidase)